MLIISKALAKAANLSHDHFIRTTDSAHREAVQYFWVREMQLGRSKPI